MLPFFEKVKHGLIVSCQSEDPDPFNSPEYVALFAKAAEMGGAVGIRSQGIEKTKKIVETVNLPVIGLLKTKFPDGLVCITGSFKAVEDLIETGCDIIAIDGTFRLREGNINGPDFISEVKKRYNFPVMADISTFEDGKACIESGVDCLSTTLSGYTPETKDLPHDRPNVKLLKSLVDISKIPVIAEGRVNTPEWAKIMIENGAWAVVAGTAITRPRIVTQWYAEAIKNA